jgi:hypothetical protein
MFRNSASGLHFSEPEAFMKYMFAWLLGVPGGLIVLWFLFNHH